MTRRAEREDPLDLGPGMLDLSIVAVCYCGTYRDVQISLPAGTSLARHDFCVASGESTSGIDRGTARGVRYQAHEIADVRVVAEPFAHRGMILLRPNRWEEWQDGQCFGYDWRSRSCLNPFAGLSATAVLGKRAMLWQRRSSRLYCEAKICCPVEHRVPDIARDPTIL